MLALDNAKAFFVFMNFYKNTFFLKNTKKLRRNFLKNRELEQ